MPDDEFYDGFCYEMRTENPQSPGPLLSDVRHLILGVARAFDEGWPSKSLYFPNLSLRHGPDHDYGLIQVFDRRINTLIGEFGRNEKNMHIKELP